MKAFSLVELSIVLVILGLLTGGILSGQSLIRAAEIRSVVTEYQTYHTAVQTFRDRYMGIPGDLRNATSFWGRNEAQCGGTHPGSNAGATGTCNGNGDGAAYGSVLGLSQEHTQLWKQLALAGLIEGTYTGLVNATGGCIVGEACPVSKLGNAGWGAFYSTTGAEVSSYTMNYGNYFRIGTGNSTTIPGGAILKPEEAWNIDTKVDDGKPAYGKVIAVFWNNACAEPITGAATATNLDAQYRVQDSSIRCALFFRQLY